MDRVDFKLEDAPKLLDAIIDIYPDSIFVADSTGRCLFVNNAHLKFLGATREEMFGRPLEELEKSGFFTPCIALMVLREKRSISIFQTLRSGKQALVTANPVFDDKGELIYVIGTSRNMNQLNELKEQLDKEQEKSRQLEEAFQHIQARQFANTTFVTESREMRHLIEKAVRIAKSDAFVLITGESGTGKEVMAHFMHSVSMRPKHPFLSINCASLPENLVESELFGYTAGAFTGADKRGKSGLFEMANHGTLFLDEVGELPLTIQAKLLRVLENMEVRRLGGTETKKVDVRIIAATNVDLEERVKKGAFREDLYFRLSVVPIELPPLRKRQEDIIPLTNFFLNHFNQKYKRKVTLNKEVLSVLENYAWLGNIRELRNLVERIIVSTVNEIISIDDLPFNIISAANPDRDFRNDTHDMKNTMDETEKSFLLKAIEQHGTSRKAAASVGMSQATFLRRLKKYNIQLP